MARILVVEDEVGLASALRAGLQDELHVVDVEADGENGLLAARHTDYDLVVLDLLLPKLPGLDVCRRLRAEGKTCSILMLTARDGTADVVSGLNAGADDYLTKPFAFAVLVARVNALLRRPSPLHQQVFRHGPLEVDLASHGVRVSGEEVSMTAKEFQILAALVRRPGAVMSKDALIQAAWPSATEPESNAVEVHIASLRRKLDRHVSGGMIQTIRGVATCCDQETAHDALNPLPNSREHQRPCHAPSGDTVGHRFLSRQRRPDGRPGRVPARASDGNCCAR